MTKKRTIDAYTLLYKKLKELWEKELEIPYEVTKKDMILFSDLLFEDYVLTDKTTLTQMMDICQNEKHLENTCHKFLKLKFVELYKKGEYL